MQRRQEEEKQQVMAGLIASPFSYAIKSGFSFTGGVRDSLCLMDLPSQQGFHQSLFDVTRPPPLQNPAMAPSQETSKTANFAASSNSSSISSSSIDRDPSMLSLPTPAPFETLEDGSLKVDGENKISVTNSKEGKKKGQKRQREPRFAFMTKCEMDHLEDGYRWRKYGQKAVKNSPFPRGYYRCTSALCGVKKRVERSFLDPRVVFTTYEGQHTHPIPVTPCVNPHFTFPGPPVLSDLHCLQAHHPIFSSYQFSSQPSDLPQLISDTAASQLPADVAATMNVGRRCCKPVGGSGFRDHGLLQDFVPSDLMKKES